jgi:hypothetical protein
VTPSDAAFATQSSTILTCIDQWLKSAPGRIVTITSELGDVVMVLHETHTSHGSSVRDAGAQISQVLIMDGTVRP